MSGIRKKSVSIVLFVGLDANRKRTNFEKDMDNFLFGGMAPVKKR
jgi:hypothetical protein